MPKDINNWDENVLNIQGDGTGISVNIGDTDGNDSLAIQVPEGSFTVDGKRIGTQVGLVAELETLNTASLSNRIVHVAGRNELGDTGAGDYLYFSSGRAQQTVDGFLIVVGEGVTDYYQRLQQEDTSEQVSSIATLKTLSTTSGATRTVLGYSAIGDAGEPWDMVYRSTGRPATENGFQWFGPGVDDWWEAVNKSVAIPERFGADPTGVADSTTAVQAAITAAAVAKVPLTLREGATYSMATHAARVALGAGSEFRLVGNGATIIGPGRTVDFIGTYSVPVEIRDVKFQDFGMVTYLSSGGSVPSFTAEGVTLTNCNSLLDGAGTHNIIGETLIRNCTGTGLYIAVRVNGDASGPANISNNNFTGVARTDSVSAIGIQWGKGTTNGPNPAVVSGNTISDFTTNGSGVETHGIIILSNYAKIINNYVENIANANLVNSEGIYTKSIGAVISGNTVIDAGGTLNGMITIKGQDIGGSAPFGYGVKVSDNDVICTDAATVCYGIHPFVDCVIEGNRISGCTVGVFGSHSGGTISGNRVVGGGLTKSAGGATGVFIESEVDGLTISDNVITDLATSTANDATGVRMRGTSGAASKNVVITDNNIHSLTSAGDTRGVFLQADHASCEGWTVTGNTVDGADYGISSLTASSIAQLEVRANSVRNAGTYYYSGVPVDVVTPEQFGAVGDGVTDDADAFLAAIATGSPVVLGAKTYRITKQLVFQGAHEFRGQGRAKTIILAEVADDFAIWVQSSGHGTVEGFALGNLTGSGIRHTGSHKSSVRDIWCGVGTRDIAFLNDGSQQLVTEGCYATTNSLAVIPSATKADIGFAATARVESGSTVGSDPNLDGLTLDLTFKAAATITISGNTLADVAASIHAQRTTTGICAYVVNDVLVMVLHPHDGSLGLDVDYDLVLADGTATWAAVGHTAATHATSSSTTYCPNASLWLDCHSEGMGLAGFMVDGIRMGTIEFPSSIKIKACVFQGNGVSGGGATSHDLYLKDTINGSIDHHSEGDAAANVKLLRAHGFNFTGSTFGKLELENSKHNTFLNSNVIGGGELDAASSSNTFIGCNLNRAGSAKDAFAELSTGNTFIGCQRASVAAASGYRVEPTNTGAGQVLNHNGGFTHWNAATSLPVGYEISSGATLQDIAVSGTGKGCRITSDGTSNSGLLFKITDNTPVSSKHSEFITIRMKAKRLTATARPRIGWNSNYWLYNTTTDSIIDEMLPLDTWVTYSATFGFGTSGTNRWVLIQAGDDASDQIEIDDLTITRGVVAPNAYATKSAEGEQAFINGRWIDYGAAAPTAGRLNLAGSIRYKDDGTGKWVCTAEGDPGTWEFRSTSPMTASGLATTVGTDGQSVTVDGYTTAGDAGDSWSMIYRATGRTGITVDGGFYLAGPGADDYWEAVDKSEAYGRRFGMVADGAINQTGTNSAAALQAALDSGSDVVALNGIFLIDSAVTIPANVTLRGDGHIVRGPNVEQLVTLSSGCAIDGLKFSQRQTVEGGNEVMIRGTSVDGVEIRNVTLDQLGHGIDFQSCTNCVVKDSRFTNFDHKQIEFSGTSTDNVAAGNHLDDGGLQTDGQHVLQLTTTSDVPCERNRFENNTVLSIGTAVHTSGEGVRHNLITGNTFTNTASGLTTTNVIKLSADSTDNVVSNNLIQGVGQGSFGVKIASNSSGIIRGNKIENVYTGINPVGGSLASVIEDNEISNTALDGITVSSAKHTIRRNRISNTARDGINGSSASSDWLTVEENEIRAAARYAWFFSGDDSTIDRNIIRDGTGTTYGAYINGDNCVVRRNRLYDNARNYIRFAGSTGCTVETADWNWINNLTFATNTVGEITPEQFGAVEGSDAKTAIEAADVAAATAGVALHFREGATYEITGDMTLTATRVIGNGALIKATASHDDVVNMTLVEYAENLTVDGGRLDAVTAGGLRGETIRASGTTNLTWNNVTAQNAPTGGTANNYYLNPSDEETVYTLNDCTGLNPGYGNFRQSGNGTVILNNFSSRIESDNVAGGGSDNRFGVFSSSVGDRATLKIRGGLWESTLTARASFVIDGSANRICELDIDGLVIRARNMTDGANSVFLKIDEVDHARLRNVQLDHGVPGASFYSVNCAAFDLVEIENCQFASYVNNLGTGDKLIIDKSTFGPKAFGDGTEYNVGYGIQGFGRAETIVRDTVFSGLSVAALLPAAVSLPNCRFERVDAEFNSASNLFFFTTGETSGRQNVVIVDTTIANVGAGSVYWANSSARRLTSNTLDGIRGRIWWDDSLGTPGNQTTGSKHPAVDTFSTTDIEPGFRVINKNYPHSTTKIPYWEWDDTNSLWAWANGSAATTAQLEDATHATNTAGKYEGKWFFNTDTGKPAYASGSGTTAVWNDSAGTLAHTPV